MKGLTNHALQKQMEFLIEIDKLKHIYRRSVLVDRSRHENDAEHSRYLAIMALILSDYANEKKHLFASCYQDAAHT
ncbi:HD domain-containing protein [Bacillus sp. 165]|uniref:HD domain-containing protein n=1 Tax=Bacillus sp. 165 TaxID=1529117 RepID=UPI0032AF3DF5